MAKVTIYDVAGAARVSLATVSRVLNNPEKVNLETRERVLKVIKELGYRPNAIARGLASRKTTNVGVIISDITRASVAEMLNGIIDIAKKYHYSTKLFNLTEDCSVNEVIRDVIAEQVDGVLLLNDELSANDLDVIKNSLDEANTPLVLANVLSERKDVPSVNINYEKAGYELTKEMIERGKKDIYLLSTVRKYSVNQSKESGYLKAMQEAGLEPRVFRTSGDTAINTAHFNEFFKNNPVDGVIAVRDSIAVSFINVAYSENRRIPEDILVCSFQNTKYAQLSRPTLTSVDIPVYDIGAVSMRLLTKLMKEEPVDEINVVLPYRVVRRKSM